MSSQQEEDERRYRLWKKSKNDKKTKSKKFFLKGRPFIFLHKALPPVNAHPNTLEDRNFQLTGFSLARGNLCKSPFLGIEFVNCQTSDSSSVAVDVGDERDLPS